MAATFTRTGAHKIINPIFSKRPTIRKYFNGGSSYADASHEVMKMDVAGEKKKKKEESAIVGGNYGDGKCCWVPHERTGIYYPKGQEKVMEDVPAQTRKAHTEINWFAHN